MAQVIEETVSPVNRNGYLLLGAGLAVASMIVIPALAMRIVLMKASSRATAVACRVPVCDSSDITCQ